MRENQTVISQDWKPRIKEAERLLSSNIRFTVDVRVKVEECLVQLTKVAPITGIGVTKEEQAMIVSAMALPKGHWFKCPKGKSFYIEHILRPCKNIFFSQA